MRPDFPATSESPVDESAGRASSRPGVSRILSVAVPLRDRTYNVEVAAGILAELGRKIHDLHPDATRVALVADAQVMALHGERVAQTVRDAKLQVTCLTVPVGEASKCQTQLFALVEGFVAAGLSRRDVVVALGGGVVGDLAGLAAATFMRGIAFIQCPTSLLAQVDASVGGKVAIDLPHGKNLFGVFHFPSAVLIDPDVLRTLDDRELACGLAEMAKHALLFSPHHLDEILAHVPAIYRRDGEVLATLVGQSVAFKAACVAQDPFEQAGEAGGRALLNLGHTVGHAIENVSDFSCKHGEAVALGLVAAARLSERRGVAAPGLEWRVASALAQLRLPTSLDEWLVPSKREAIVGYLSRDKKRVSTGVAYVALRAIGEPVMVTLRAADILSSIVND